MNRIKVILFLFLGAGLFLTSCTKEEDENYFAKLDPRGAVAVISDVSGFFDITNPDAQNISFTLSTKGETVNSIEVFKSVRGGEEFSIGTFSSFPAEVVVSFSEVLGGTGLSADDMNPGDQATFRTVVNAASGSYPGQSVSFDFSCSSDLAGMMDVTTVGWCDGSPVFTGTAELVETGAGTYVAADMSFGAYEVCYGPGSALPEGTLEIQDICNKLSYIGVSQWGEVYQFNSMTVDGSTLTFDWENDYGEAGKTTLTRQDGRDWPNLTF